MTNFFLAIIRTRLRTFIWFLKGSTVRYNRNSGRKENNFCHSIKSPFSYSFFFVMLSFDKGNLFIKLKDQPERTTGQRTLEAENATALTVSSSGLTQFRAAVTQKICTHFCHSLAFNNILRRRWWMCVLCSQCTVLLDKITILSLWIIYTAYLPNFALFCVIKQLAFYFP